MKTVKNATIYNNGHDSKINLFIVDEKTGKSSSMTANIVMSDLKRFLKKQATEMEIAEKYFNVENGNITYIKI